MAGCPVREHSAMYVMLNLAILLVAFKFMRGPTHLESKHRMVVQVTRAGWWNRLTSKGAISSMHGHDSSEQIVSSLSRLACLHFEANLHCPPTRSIGTPCATRHFIRGSSAVTSINDTTCVRKQQPELLRRSVALLMSRPFAI